MKKKIWLSVAALALVLCCAVGGTLAWLTDKTEPVKNTFTIGDINIDLSESEKSRFEDGSRQHHQERPENYRKGWFRSLLAVRQGSKVREL